jgi:BON domain
MLFHQVLSTPQEASMPSHSFPRLCLIFSLLASVGLAASCNKLGRPDDTAITTDIKAKMFSDPALKSANVDVSSHAGEVTLTGQVPDDSARLAAYKIANEAKGVSKVNDQMTVMAAQAAAPAASAAPVETAPDPAPKKEPPARRQPKPKSAPPATSPDAQPAPSEAPTPAAPAEKPSAPVPAPPQPRTVTVPSGAVITVRTIDSVDSAVNRTGQVFKAALDAPIVVDDRVIVPKGGDAYIKLANASSAGKLAGRSELTMELQSIVFQGRTYNLTTSDVKQSGSSRGKDSAVKIGGGAALGALIGGLAGGGKGAAIGAAVGGGAGTGVQVFTKGKQIKIPSETRLDFTLEQPFDITYTPSRRSRPAQAPVQNSDQPPSAPDASADRPPAS